MKKEYILSKNMHSVLFDFLCHEASRLKYCYADVMKGGITHSADKLKILLTDKEVDIICGYALNILIGATNGTDGCFGTR